MHRHVVAVFVMLSVVVILVTMHYSMQNTKAIWHRPLWSKGWQKKENISVWEAERQLDADVYITEHQYWVPFGLHYASSCCTGCSSMQQPRGRKNVTMPSATAGGSHHLLHEIWRWSHVHGRARLCKLWWERRKQRSTKTCLPIVMAAGEITLWYRDEGVSPPGNPGCHQGMSLVHKWVSKLPEERLSLCPTSTPQLLTPKLSTVAKTVLIMTQLKDMMQDSCEENCSSGEGCPLVSTGSCGAAGRQDREIKSLTQPWSLSIQGAWNCRCLGSHWQRSWAGSHQKKVPQVEECQGESSRRWAQSPNPVWLRQWVIFEDSPSRGCQRWGVLSLNLWGWQQRNRESHQIGPDQNPEQRRRISSPHLLLTLWLQEFLTGGEAPWASNRLEDDPQQTCDACALPPQTQWMDLLASTASENASLVARTLRSSWPEWHQGNLTQKVCKHLFRYQKQDTMPPK